MINKSIITVLMFTLFSLQIEAQQADASTILIKEWWSIGLATGTTQFHGDFIEDKKVSPAFSLQLSRPIDYNHSIQAEFFMGRLSGENLFSSICENPFHTQGGSQVEHQREGEVFNAEFMEFDVNFLINISSLFDRGVDSQNHQSKTFARNRKLNFLTKVGIGLNMFRTVRKELGTDQFINSYGYQWLWENDYKDAGTKHLAWSETITERTFVLGFITRYKISQRFTLDFSATSRSGGNDKWDAKLDDKSDMFIFYSLGTTFRWSD